MSMRMRLIFSLGTALLLAVSGCGSSETVDQTVASTETGTTTVAKPHASAPAKPHVSPPTEKNPPAPGSTEPAREFLGSNGGNMIATWGKEGSVAERERASRTIENWMRARAATDWAKDCSYLSRRYRHTLVAEDAEEVSNGEVKNCPQALAYFRSAASGDYVNTLSGPIDSLRVTASDEAYALYHGRDGNDWSVPMKKERGSWWVAISMPSELEG